MKFDQVYSSPPVVSLSVSQVSADPEEELWYKVMLGSVDVAGFEVVAQCQTTYSRYGYAIKSLDIDWMSLPTV